MTETTYPGMTDDRLDTGLRRLIVYIGERGVSAYLKNVFDTEAPARMILSERWERDSEKLLSRIETAVYDNPELLADYEADIIIETPHIIFIPDELAADEDISAAVFKSVYNAEDEDVSTDLSTSPAALFTLVKGLNAFVRRTFPGARIASHLGIILRHLTQSGAAGNGSRFTINIREKDADILLTSGRKLIMATVKEWSEPADLLYHLANIASVYGLNNKETEIHAAGNNERRTEIFAMLRDHFGYVGSMLLPAGTDRTIPLAAAICASRRPTARQS